MLIFPIYCIDSSDTKIFEDGYYIHSKKASGGVVLKLILAAVSVTPEELYKDILYAKLGKSSRASSLIRNRLFHPEYISEHHLGDNLTVPAIVVEFEINDSNYHIQSNVTSLASVKKIRQFTHTELEKDLDKKERLRLKKYIKLINKIITNNNIPQLHSSEPSDPTIEKFVVRMLNLYNHTCTEFCIKNNIPYIGRYTQQKKSNDTHLLGKFNCPLRHPEAVINNINLSHFLKHGKPYYSENDIELFVEYANKNSLSRS